MSKPAAPSPSTAIVAIVAIVANVANIANIANVARVLVVAGALVVAGLSLGACSDPAECRNDAECATGACSNGSCVTCNATHGCADGQFCCVGQCHPDSDIQSHCGCSAELAGSDGQDCNNVDPAGLCLVGTATASTDTVSSGSCGCGCTPATGGPLCTAPATAGDDAICSCSDNADCKRASEDAAGHPHRAADTCTPQSTCVCFSASTANAQLCDPDGATPDCTLGGCISLVTDGDNCGVPGKVCTDDTTGVVAAGLCVNGGCSCDAASDCIDGGNVDACVFPVGGGDATCVCNSYTRAGVASACPMALDCAANGCILDGTAFTTEEALLSDLGLPPAP